MDAQDLPERSVDIRLSYHVGIVRLDAVLAITNRARRPVQFEVAWILARTSQTSRKHNPSDGSNRRTPREAGMALPFAPPVAVIGPHRSHETGIRRSPGMLEPARERFVCGNSGNRW